MIVEVGHGPESCKKTGPGWRSGNPGNIKPNYIGFSTLDSFIDRAKIADSFVYKVTMDNKRAYSRARIMRTLERVRDTIGTIEYHMFNENCEQYAYYWAYGHFYSSQTEWAEFLLKHAIIMMQVGIHITAKGERVYVLNEDGCDGPCMPRTVTVSGCPCLEGWRYQLTPSKQFRMGERYCKVDKKCAKRTYDQVKVTKQKLICKKRSKKKKRTFKYKTCGNQES